MEEEERGKGGAWPTSHMYRHLLGFVLIAAHVVVLQHCCGVVQMCILLVTDVCASHNPEQYLLP